MACHLFGAKASCSKADLLDLLIEEKIPKKFEPQHIDFFSFIENFYSCLDMLIF